MSSCSSRGATYVGKFVLPNKGAINDDIVVRSGGPDSALPPAGNRMTPAYRALLAKIKSPNTASSMRTAPATNHWKLMFLEFQANQNGAGDIIALGAADSTQSNLSQVPHHLMLDRVYVHGDPVHVQFSSSVTSSGTPVYRIGTTQATVVILEDFSGAGISGWGWQDDRSGGLAPPIYFQVSGPQTIRVQQREDGISIDQIVLSDARYLSVSPGALKNDTTVVPK